MPIWDCSKRRLGKWTMTESSIFQTFAGIVHNAYIPFICQYTHLVSRLGTIKPCIGHDSWDINFLLESQTDVEDYATRPGERQQAKTSYSSPDNSASYATGKVNGKDRVGSFISNSLDCR